MDENFLLSTKTAQTIYHDYAAKMPIIDYHCHIVPDEIANNRRFDNIAQAWLGADHYKWRLMRAAGTPEELVTGNGSDYEKFLAFAKALPNAIGNPLYHWAQLELQRYFGYNDVLNESTAKQAWEHCNERLRNLPVNELIKASNVELIVSTDDPIDSLDSHKAIAAAGKCSAAVQPGWRPDKALGIDKAGYPEYIEKLSAAAGIKIVDINSLKAALCSRLDYFEAAGCKISDHGMDFIPFRPNHETEAESSFKNAVNGIMPTPEEIEAFRFEILLFLGREYSKRGFIMQLHYAPFRNVNSKRFATLGPDTGYDCIGNQGTVERIAGFLDALDKTDSLPKTVIYSLNPNDNAMLCSIIGGFQHGAAGKVQHGAAWWFNDTKTGMEDQLINLANHSLLGNFIGMLTDSRSFLSYTRHEYFRRILCNLIGGWVENGEYPADIPLLGKMVQDISYNNVKNYIKL